MNSDLDRWLQEVSRSFYLSLKILPTELREPLSLAYLWARDLDTIADQGGAQSIADRRRALDERLALLNLALGSEELKLTTDLYSRIRELARLTHALPVPVKETLKNLFKILPQAMIFDLEYFQTHTRVESLSQTETYTDWAAGCVGVAWTELCAVLFSDCAREWDLDLQKSRGRALGQFLQWVNILRDQGQDHKAKRSYLPVQYDQSAAAIIESHVVPRVKEGLLYVQAIPKSQTDLLVSVSLPLILGLKTLEGLKTKPGFKMSRTSVLMALAQCKIEARFNRSALYRGIQKQIDLSAV